MNNHLNAVLDPTPAPALRPIPSLGGTKLERLHRLNDAQPKVAWALRHCIKLPKKLSEISDNARLVLPRPFAALSPRVEAAPTGWDKITA